MMFVMMGFMYRAASGKESEVRDLVGLQRSTIGNWRSPLWLRRKGEEGGGGHDENGLLLFKVFTMGKEYSW